MGTLGAIKNESLLSRELRRRRRPRLGSLACVRARKTPCCSAASASSCCRPPPGFASPASRAARRRSIRTSGRAEGLFFCQTRSAHRRRKSTGELHARPPAEGPRQVVPERRKADSPPLCRWRSSNEGACFGATSFGSTAASAVGRRRQPEPAASTATPASLSSQEVAFVRAFGGGEVRTISSPTLVVVALVKLLTAVNVRIDRSSMHCHGAAPRRASRLDT
jgi:hypothetical protein